MFWHDTENQYQRNQDVQHSPMHLWTADPGMPFPEYQIWEDCYLLWR